MRLRYWALAVVLIALSGCASNADVAGNSTPTRNLDVVAEPNLGATTHFKVIYAFTGGSDGSQPWSDVVLDSSGNLYGTTYFGGAANDGVVFRLDASGTESVIHSFRGPDGQNPVGNLIRDAAGNLYGTTSLGGAHNYGVLFKIDTNGIETVLHSFHGDDGTYPSRELYRDLSGDLFGTTIHGGRHGCGVVFEFTTAGHFVVMHSFNPAIEGCVPATNLVRDAAGDFFGATNTTGVLGSGSFFKLKPNGSISVIHAFAGDATDGGSPEGEIVQDDNGAMFGTTLYGGASGNGTVYEISASGNERTLWSFDGNDGSQPIGGVFRDSAGDVYGTTSSGGLYRSRGVLFELEHKMGESVLFNFGVGDGYSPSSSLTMDSSKNVYGTANLGGFHGHGVVFEYTHS